MGLFSALKRQLLKVIEWKDDSSDTIVYRYPMEDRVEIMNGCQLIVGPAQTAILVKEGQIADVYGPGLHKLETKNMPILTSLASWKYGFDSPFKADVYYVNTKQFINQTWGTTNPVMMRDRDFGMIRVRAHGKFSFRVSDPAVLMREIFGTNRDYRTASLIGHFRSIVVSSFADALGEANIPALDIAAKYRELADVLIQTSKDDFAKMGISVESLYIENVSLPQEVEQAIDKRTSVGVMGDKMQSFMQYQTAEAIRDAAKNEGGVAGAGVGLGAGLGMGQMFAEAMKTAKDEPKPTEVAKVACSKCGKMIPADAKFCPECGEKRPEKKFCVKCGKPMPASANFCPECGTKVGN